MNTWKKTEKMTSNKINENSDISVDINNPCCVYAMKSFPKRQYSFG